jgi:hypothetical protein
LDRGINRLIANIEYSTKPATEWDGPFVPVGRLPVGSHDGTRRQVPSIRHIVIDERLDCHQVDIGAVAVTRERPNIVDQRTISERLLDDKDNATGSRRPFA